MRKSLKFLLALLVLLPLISINVFGYSPDEDDEYYDDYIPEQSARVARIKVLEGNAQIKRNENEDWERAVENLPLVEGDEIVTERNARIEIQFDKDQFLRLDEKSYLKIVNLHEEGITVSLSQGSLNLTLLEFNQDKEFFEIDVPQTTVAIQKDGKYRINAGDEYNKEVFVAVNDGGEARIYSSDSGFTLKTGRTAKLYLDGDYAGEWETERNSRYSDDFDEWSAERDAIIERRLRNANANRYYDESIYGADELNDYGEWVYARDYGYVWRPYGNSISRYSNWSPYRYGHWRWLPYYGWTWVNDEPWGWATYHHGRWFYHNGYWVWSPYSRSRSYWRPAIVYITYVGDSYCWYPLPWGYRYYNYNYGYRDRWRNDRRNRRDRRDDRDGRNNNNQPTTPRTSPENIARANRNLEPPLGRVPRDGVVSVSKDDFGNDTKGVRRPPLSVADEVLKRKPVIENSPPLIPTFEGKVSKEIIVPNRRGTVFTRDDKIGASERKDDGALDEKLRERTIFGNRQPMQPRNNPTVESNDTKTTSTGVFDRSKRPTVTTNSETKTTPRSDLPTYTPRSSENKSNTNRTEERKSPPIYTPQPRTTPQPERKTETPVYKPQPRREQPRPTPQPKSEPKRESPPPKRESKPPLSKSESKSKDN